MKLTRSDKEWLLTDGYGSYAMGSLDGVPRRRYHSYLSVPGKNDCGRDTILLHSWETLKIGDSQNPIFSHMKDLLGAFEGGQDEKELANIRWVASITQPKTKGPRTLTKKLSLMGKATLLIDYRFDSPLNSDAKLNIHFFTPLRNHHHLVQTENSPLAKVKHDDLSAVFETGLETQPYLSFDLVGEPGHTLRLSEEKMGAVEFFYSIDAQRGFGASEHLSPGISLEVDLPRFSSGFTLRAIVTETPSLPPFDSFERYPHPFTFAHQLDSEPPTPTPRKFKDRRDALAFQMLRAGLEQAARDFIIMKNGRLTIVAGYPWFEDWGRDTFISLTGLCLVTRQFETARAILEGFFPYVKDGLIPNVFGADGDASYNNVDGTLWYLHAAANYVEYTKDLEFAFRFLAPLKEIVEHHQNGTRFGISIDPEDGLLQAGQQDLQLTWMDAKIDSEIVTQRAGKPIEVNGLWISSLHRWSQFAATLKDDELSQTLAKASQRANESFEKFWLPQYGWYADVLKAPALGVETDDFSLRPNQAIALSLPHINVNKEHAQHALKEIRSTLLVSCGLRTLSPFDIKYKPLYIGNPVERDRSYHQGTVWPWLLGPYLSAVRRHCGEEGWEHMRDVLIRFSAHVGTTCVNHVSEIYDAEAPHLARGAPAQAWSVAEPLRALVEDFL